jgi:hypothetical protein
MLVTRRDTLQEEKAREEERLRLEEERRILEEEEEEIRAREEAKRRANQRKNELDRKRSRLPSKPREGLPAFSPTFAVSHSRWRVVRECSYLIAITVAGEVVCNVVVRLPDGSRLTRRFRMWPTQSEYACFLTLPSLFLPFIRRPLRLHDFRVFMIL